MPASFTTDSALHELGASESTLTAAEKEKLDRDGFLPLPGLLTPAQLEALRRREEELLSIEKESAGKEVHLEAGTARLANLVNKGDVFRVCYTHPRLLAAVAHVLNHDFKFSGLNSRAALPGEGMQGLHADWHYAVEPGDYKVCNSIWLLDDFTPDNGATRYVSGSHRLGKMPHETLADPKVPHPQEELLLGPAGTVVVFNSHLWHGGTVNRTSARRRALHSYWCRRSEKQQLNQRQFLSPETKASFSPALRYLFDV